MRAVATPHGTVGYTDHGAGPVLLFVHGFLLDKSMWLPQIVHFVPLGYRVLCVDLLGFGDSEPVPGTIPLTAHAVALTAVLDAVGAETATVTGYSIGGQVALDFAGSHPDRLTALVLSGTSAGVDSPVVRAERLALADRLESEGVDEYAEEFLPHLLGARTIRDRPSVVEHALTMMAAADPEGAAAVLRGRAERGDYTAVARALTVPSLVVVGAEDSFDRGELAAELAGLVPGSRLAVVADSGHTPSLERPLSFNAELEEFLESVSGAARPGPLRVR
ncbi:alpha/beta fold hydrolase [Nocardia sp. alder85J]|uniref:alpha/beta fold hydrolase n=1 Tax=Nocardia sp. alder85J TaxID=2862949 RepID=UPI001CD7AA68|nr:alpha/beta hydrolase [Nocardia sp. alder85J]MCX4092598.1 alpha/beta hydrolase [Nocardia sp. alder85J]